MKPVPPQSFNAETDALLVRGVSHRFGPVPALDDVSLTVPRGGFVVLLGPNGAGKSTLFALITRLFDNVTGEIRILGHDVRRQPAAALRQLGVVFQSRSLDADLTVLQNLAYHAALHGIGRPEGRRRALEALDKVGLADRAGARVRTLSGGQSRRVEIARALLHDPACLLLDEATVGLDVASRESALAIVRGLVKERGVGVLWATHLVDEVADDDRVVLLHKGRVRFAGPFPPGITQVQIGYRFPYSGETATIAQPWPTAFEQLFVAAENVGKLQIASPQFQQQQEANAGGQPFLMATGGRLNAGESLSITLTGLPHRSRLLRNVGVGIGVLILAAGFWFAITGGKDSKREQQELERRKEKLLSDLVALEGQHRQGRIDERRYASRRQSLVTQLERVMGELDDPSAFGPRSGGPGGQGVAA